jgi:hypothetical protein
LSEVKSWYDSVQHGHIKFVPGLPLLQEYIPAWIPGHLIVLTGYTSAGKSQLLSQITASTAGVNESETLVISVEDSTLEKKMSLIGVISGCHKRNMLLGIPGYDEIIEQSEQTINHWPLHIYDDVYTVSEIEDKIKEHKPKIVVIDYIQNLRLQGGSIYERISSATPLLFQMASRHQCTLFVVSQIDNQSAKDETEGFIASKGAGELVAAAHSVIHLKKGRSEGNWDKVEIYIKKNKAFGKCGKIDCNFNQTWTAIEATEEIRQFHAERLKARGRHED